MKELNRSTFLKYSALPLLGLALQKCLSLQSKPFLQKEANFSPTVLVIGGGISGICAAMKLQEYGISAQIVEAQSYFGGRMKSVLNDNSVSAELGAQLFNQDMKEIINLLERNYLEYSSVYGDGNTFSLNATGKEVWDEDSNIYDWIDEEKFLTKLDSKDIDQDFSLSEAIDAMTDEKEKRVLLKNMFRELMGKNPELVSTRGTYELYKRFNSERDADELHCENGLGRLIESLIQKLEYAPIHSYPITRILWKNGKFISTSKKGVIESNYLILAVPPPIIQKISIEPKLPQAIQKAISSFDTGDMIKITLVFKEPFWRKKGWNGSFVSNVYKGVTVIDSSLKNQKQGKLVLFIGAETALNLSKKKQEHRQEFAYNLTKQAFSENWQMPLEYYEGIWVKHPWCGGGYNSFVKYGGTPNAAEVLRNYNSNLLFAGSEISAEFPGYMEGGIRSGYSAAKKIHSKIKSQKVKP
ncbi:MAG: FAD-dependent oxidoreductase [Leptospiraceae bacterium]|nr:FAD-dependent oxidoreductase [Leptospiraceae bacterium]